MNATIPSINTTAAQQFLAALDGRPDTNFTFQIFDDSPNKDPAKARIVHCRGAGTFANVADLLINCNSQGCGIFVTVNSTDGRGRKTENVIGLRACFVDADDLPLPAQWHLQPDLLVHRDATHWHAYWLLEAGQPLDGFRAAQERLASHYGTDPGIKDLPRVMRLPGFLHCKQDPPLLVTWQDMRSEGPPLTLEDVMAGLKAAPALPVDAVQAPPTGPAGQRNGEYHRAQRYAAAKPPASEGQRNVELNLLAFALLERFELSQSDLREICQTWAMTCTPPLQDPEAATTIASAWTGCHRKGAALSKRLGGVRPLSPPGHQNQPKDAPTDALAATEQPDLDEPASPEVDDSGESELLRIHSEIQDLHEILKNPPSRPADLIANVAFVGSKITLAAPSKARKTFFQLHIGLCVATGNEWFGHKTLQSRVLYLNLELNPWSLQNRCGEILKRMEAHLDVDEFHVWNLRGQSVTIEKLQYGLATRLNGAQYGLICVDPLYKILGDREENAAGGMGDLLGKLEQIGHDAGAAVLVAHHFAKGNSSEKSAIDRAAGSGVVARDGDLIMTLTPHEQEDCYSLEMIQRDHAPVASSVLRWIYPVFETDKTLNPENLKKNTQRAVPVTSDDILAAATTLPQARETITEAVMKSTGRGYHAVRSAFDCAVEKDLLRIESTPRTNARPLLRYSKK